MATVAEILMAQGRQAGNARRQQGESSSRTWMDVADIIQGAGQQYARERVEAPIRAQQLEARGIELENAKAEQVATKRATEERGVLGSAVASGLDPAEIEQQLTQGGYANLVPAFRKSWQDSETSKLTMKKARAEAEEAEADYFGALASGVKAFDYDIGAVKTAFAKAKQDGYEDADGILQQLEQNPQSVKAMVDSLIQKSPTQREFLGKEQDRALSQTRENRALSASQQLQADREADNKRADAAAMALQRDREADNRRADQTAARAGSGDNEPLEKIVGPDGKVVYVRRRDAIGKTPGAGTEKSSSGVQKRVLNFFNRAEQADKDLQVLEPEIEKLGLAGQAWQSMAPNFAQTQLGQSYTAAQRAFTEARLRKDSGAAIPKEEFANDRLTYFVQPGDSKKTIQDKNRARAAMLASLAFESGQALGEFIGDADEARSVVEGYKARAARPGDGTKTPRDATDQKVDPLGIR